jgi:DNA-binding XRE family transcriptional regulator
MAAITKMPAGAPVLAAESAHRSNQKALRAKQAQERSTAVIEERTALELRTKRVYGIWAVATGDIPWEHLSFFEMEAWREIVKLIESEAQERFGARARQAAYDIADTAARREPVIRRLGRELASARAKHHITLAAAARATGVSASTLRRIENRAARNCNGLTLMLICAWAAKLGYTEFCGFSITPVGETRSSE